MHSDLVQARRIQALPSKFLSDFNFTDCFGREGLVLDANNCLKILRKPLLFLSYQVPYTRTRTAPANAIYQRCLQRRRALALFNLPLHHCAVENAYHLSSSHCGYEFMTCSRNNINKFTNKIYLIAPTVICEDLSPYRSIW